MNASRVLLFTGIWDVLHCSFVQLNRTICSWLWRSGFGNLRKFSHAFLKIRRFLSKSATVSISHEKLPLLVISDFLVNVLIILNLKQKHGFTSDFALF